MRVISIIVSIVCLLVSCSESSPKPKVFNRIDIPQYVYRDAVLPYLEFSYSELAQIDTLNLATGTFNIVYPKYNAILYCTYLPINKEMLASVLEDNHRFVYSHASMANSIDQKLYTNPDNKVSGIMYEINGNVATPLQFFVTDSVANFLRGSLYYNDVDKIDVDSVTPITQMIEGDIQRLMESLQWGGKKQ